MKYDYTRIDSRLKHTALTSDLLLWYETLVDVKTFSDAQIQELAHIAYCACMSAHGNSVDCSALCEGMTDEQRCMIRILESEYGNRLHLPIPTEEETETSPEELTEDIDARTLPDVCREFCSYRESRTDLEDILHQIADSNTSIYYSDILRFISENPHSLADVISEGLYDPFHDYDLYKHGQAAEYMTIEQSLWEHLHEALCLLACDTLRYSARLESVPVDLMERVKTWIEDAQNSPHDHRPDDIMDIVREYHEEVGV